MHNEKEKYEKLARYLDGEKVELGADALAMLEEFRQAEAMVRDKLTVEAPPETTRQLRDKLNIAISASPRPRRIIPIFRWAAAAAVAIIILSSAIFFQASDSKKTGTEIDLPSQALTVQTPLADPDDDEIADFLEPLFVDNTAQVLLDNGLSETDLIDAYQGKKSGLNA